MPGILGAGLFLFRGPYIWVSPRSRQNCKKQVPFGFAQGRLSTCCAALRMTAARMGHPAIPGLKSETWGTLSSWLSKSLRYGPPAVYRE
jgi:hypothetical protein